jgi:hypothetical protein
VQEWKQRLLVRRDGKPRLHIEGPQKSSSSQIPGEAYATAAARSVRLRGTPRRSRGRWSADHASAQATAKTRWMKPIAFNRLAKVRA